ENSSEVGFRRLPSPQHHPGGNGDLRIGHALGEQLLTQVRGNQCIILHLVQERSDPLECLQEMQERFVSIALPHLFFRNRHAVPGRERAYGGWTNGAFQVQVQLSFGKRDNSWGECVGSHGWLISGEAAASPRWSTP